MSAAQPKLFAVDSTKMFDPRETQSLQDLLTTPRSERSNRWAAAFFAALWNASLELPANPVFHGPDFFSYMRLHIPSPHQTFASNSVANLARSAVDQALGIALFASPTATEPEFVLSMGLLDSLLTYDSWLGDPVDLDDIARLGDPQTTGQPAASGLHEIPNPKGQQILVGSPASTLLPPHTARALHRHLTDGWKIPDPRVALLVSQTSAPTRNLVINRRLSQFASPRIAGQQGRFLLWYLPPRRSLILMPDSFTEDQMRPLTEYFDGSTAAPSPPAAAAPEPR